jgi:hypothetical protein
MKKAKLKFLEYQNFVNSAMENYATSLWRLWLMRKKSVKLSGERKTFKSTAKQMTNKPIITEVEASK